MNKFALVFVVLLGACAKAAPPPADSGPHGAIAFKVLTERQTPVFCVDSPEFEVATDEAGWIDVFDMETACRPQNEVTLPDVDFATHVAVAAWWKVEPCLGYRVHTDSVERTADGTVVVTAHTTAPAAGTACASARGQLESFLSLTRSNLLTGSERFRFVLDGSPLGEAVSSAAPAP